MTLDQILSVVLILAAVGLLIHGRIRYDVAAAVALVAGVAIGVVPAERAFAGFGDQIVITVGSALVVSAALGRSGAVQRLMRPMRRLMRGPGSEVVVLSGLVAALSGFIKNIAALAMLMPVALQTARRSQRAPGYLLMPMSFGALLGGMITPIGTSPNIVVSQMRAEISGEPFGMFDFAPVAIGLTVAGVLFLSVGWRLLPLRGRPTGPEGAFAVEDYRFEIHVPVDSPVVGRTVGDLEAMADAEIAVVAIIREGFRRYVPAGHWWIFADDILVVQGDAGALQSFLTATRLKLADEAHPEPAATGSRQMVTAEAVVSPGSPLIGQSAGQMRLREIYRVNLLGISRHGARLRQRLRRVRFQPGDLVVLQGPSEQMPDTLAALGCYPLAERNVPFGHAQRMAFPFAVLAVAILLVTFQVVPVALGFFAAAVAMVVGGSITVREAYEAVDWPVLVLLACLIPISDALRATGATDVIAGWIAHGAMLLPPAGAVALTMAAAMAVTPFLNNAAAVLVMAPIGAGLAARLGLSPDPFLMAVAVGAACDFLTPIGHQCNTLVMGPGGYRFGDYWRLGLPLSVLVVGLGTALITWFWPV